MAREDKLTPEQRLDAIAEIFARGVHRWLIKQERESAVGATKHEETDQKEQPEAAQPQ